MGLVLNSGTDCWFSFIVLTYMKITSEAWVLVGPLDKRKEPKEK